LSENQEFRKQAGIHLMVGFRGITFEEELERLIRDYFIGGAVLFRRNIQDAGQLKDLIGSAQQCAVESLGRPILLSIDQEGGPVQRLMSPPFPKLPSAETMSKEGPESVRTWAGMAAQELKELGIHINLAPVLDVLPAHTTEHFMKERSLGSDPHQVAQLGMLWIKEMQRKGVSATAKHFPGLGQAELDPHHYAPTIQWSDGASMERDLIPFQEAINSGVHCIMTSHALYPSVDSHWPATLSPALCSLWLREKMGFEGVLLSDDLDMAAVEQRFSWGETACQGLLATVDFFLLCQKPENIEPFFSSFIDLLSREPRFMTLHEQSLKRIRLLHERLGLEWTGA
jgi:beta-N-acetylhexosaminidase